MLSTCSHLLLTLPQLVYVSSWSLAECMSPNRHSRGVTGLGKQDIALRRQRGNLANWCPGEGG